MEFQNLQILLIEDCEIDTEAVLRLLRQTGRELEIHSASTLQAGLKIIRECEIDLVLTDLTLPDSSGVPTVLSIRLASENLPIIVLTGRDDKELATELLAVGAQDYVIKGQVTCDGLDRAIRYSVQRQQNYTRIRRLMAEIEEKNLMLTRKNRELSEASEQAHQYVDNVSHEFRTPLTVVKEYVSLVREGLAGPVNEKQSSMLRIVEDRASDLNMMVDDFLDASKLEAGMLGVWRREHSIDDIVDPTRVAIDRKAKVRDVNVKWHFDSDLPLAFCDREKAGRVLINLAINAIKFCGVGGEVIIACRGLWDSKEIQISVRDNGPGIDEKALESIFQRFKQITTGVNHSVKGFGLGLSIAKELVELNFGRMNVESQLGVGSTFSFTLPMSDNVEVLRAYTKWMSRVHAERIRDDEVKRALNISFVLASVQDEMDEEAADDVDSYINYCLRRFDVVFQRSACNWILAMPDDGPMTEEALGNMRLEWEATNRNRPFGQLPKVDFKILETYVLPLDEQRMLATFRQAMDSDGRPTALPNIQSNTEGIQHGTHPCS